MSYLPALKDFHPETQAFYRDKRVIVTGGSGFIGSHVVEQLVMLGARPVAITRQRSPEYLQRVKGKIDICQSDLNDYSSLKAAFESIPIVLHLAAKVAGIEYNMQHPATIFRDNMMTFLNVIQAAAKANVNRFLVTSSACVYPRNCKIPTPEDEGFVGEPDPSNLGYGWMKRMAECLGRLYSQEFDMSVAIARPYNAYGPRDNFDKKTAHVIPSLIRKAFESTNGEFAVWGDGSHTRSFVHARDFAMGLLEVAARYPEADPINIGIDEEISIKQLAYLIAKNVSEVTGKEVKPVFEKSGITGQPRRHCDVTKAKEKLDFEGKTSFSEGIRETVLWYKEYENSTMRAYAK